MSHHNERFNYYNKQLQPLAKVNRKKMTKAEACLWKYVLRAKMTGYTFNRQRPVLNYIADFMCKPLKLIIEIDGITHAFEEVKQNDIIRQKKLEEAGFRVIRFTDREVLTGISAVQKSISATIQEIETNLNREKSTDRPVTI